MTMTTLTTSLAGLLCMWRSNRKMKNAFAKMKNAFAKMKKAFAKKKMAFANR